MVIKIDHAMKTYCLNIDNIIKYVDRGRVKVVVENLSEEEVELEVKINDRTDTLRLAPREIRTMYCDGYKYDPNHALSRIKSHESVIARTGKNKYSCYCPPINMQIHLDKNYFEAVFLEHEQKVMRIAIEND